MFFHLRRRAASITPYALVVGLISVVAIAVVTQTGNSVSNLFDETAGVMEGATIAAGPITGPSAAASPSASASAQPSPDVDPPVWTTAAGQIASVETGGSLSTNVVATDAVTPPVTYTKTGGDSWISADSAGNITGTAPGSSGTYSITMTATDGASNVSTARTFTVDVTAPGQLAVSSSAIITDGPWEVQCQQWSGTTCTDPRLRNATAFSYVTSCQYTNNAFSNPNTDWMGLLAGTTDVTNGDCHAWCILAGHTGAVSTSETPVTANISVLNFYGNGQSPSGQLCNGKTTPNSGCCTYPPSTTNNGSSVAYLLNLRSATQNYACRCDGW